MELPAVRTILLFGRRYSGLEAQLSFAFVTSGEHDHQKYLVVAEVVDVILDCVRREQRLFVLGNMSGQGCRHDDDALGLSARNSDVSSLQLH